MYKQIFFILTLSLLSAGIRAETAVDESRPMNADGRIQLSAATGDYRIVGHDDNQLVITGTLGTDVSEFTVDGSDGAWRIELRSIEYSGRMPRRTTGSNLTIRVPYGAEIDAATVSGNIKAESLTGYQVRLQSVSGQVRLDNVVPERLEVQTVSGAQRMDAGGTRVSRLRSVSGNIHARGLAGRVNVNSVSGSITLDASNIEELELETVSGRASADLIPAGGDRYRISSHSGNVSVTLPAETPLALRANTFSGRISSAFGGEVRRGRGPGEQLDHRVGGGSVQLESKSFSGNISIGRSD